MSKQVKRYQIEQKKPRQNHYVEEEETPLQSSSSSSNNSTNLQIESHQNNQNQHYIEASHYNNNLQPIMADDRRILYRIATDVFLLACVGFPILFFFLWGEPYKRGFFCDDESLMHPFLESTVRNYWLYIIGLVVPICLIIATEVIHVGTSSTREWVINAYKQIGVFGFGAACSQLTTDIAKYSIGRLRPHFFSVCQPLINGLNCSDPINHGKYIEDFQCIGAGSSERMLKEMRLSFPSGHSSFSAYTMIYCAIYLQCRMTWKWSKLLKHVIQFGLIMMAWYTALSRISDYKHHWSDVLAGAVLGTTVAIVVSTGVSDLFTVRRRDALLKSRIELRSSPNNHENGRV